MSTVTMRELPLAKAFQLIEPGPVVLLTTRYREQENIMTLSWHMMMEFTPLIGVLVSGGNYSFAALKKTRECVIAIPTVDLLDKVVGIGNCDGPAVDKFKKFKLSPAAASRVRAPLIMDCLANIECRVVDTGWVNKYNLFVLEGVKAWIDPKRRERRTFHANGDGTFVVDGKTRNLRRRMTKWQAII
ncbi:MAG: flavin reductase family protein [Verrucomicrobiales bacterium]|nr:flavin reductase family protein [Verrucomicrobiales bacterium]